MTTKDFIPYYVIRLENHVSGNYAVYVSPHGYVSLIANRDGRYKVGDIVDKDDRHLK